MADKPKRKAPRPEDQEVRTAENGTIPLPSRPVLLRKDLAPLYAAINLMRGTGGISVAVSPGGIVISGAGGKSDGGSFLAQLYQFYEPREVIVCTDGAPETIQVLVLKEG